MELSNLQKSVVETKERYVVVNSCAGSGKTRSLTERVKYLIKNGVAAKDIVVITFTNAAADTMRERIGEAPGLNCSTIHSYANRLLNSIGVDTAAILKKENFDELFELVKQNRRCLQNVEHLLLDEGQDSTEVQFEFMFDVINPKNWMIFSDHRQSIFRFAGADPDYIIELLNKPSVTVYNLNENYRNGYEILNYARSLIAPLGWEYFDDSRAMSKFSGKVLTVECSFEGISKTIKRRTDEGIDEYRDWFILTRTNADLDKMRKTLDKYDIPNCTFKRSKNEIEDFEQRMSENSVKVITIHTAKGLEAKNVVVIGSNFIDKEERCLSYVAATRAQELLVWTYRKHFPQFNRRDKKSNIKVNNWEE